MYVAIQNICQNTPPIPTALKADMLMQNKYIPYFKLELHK
jgi:hypothetical protein